MLPACSPVEPKRAVKTTVGDVDIAFWENKLEDETWLSPGVVEISNLYPGAQAEWEIKIHNGNQNEAQFAIEYAPPNRTREGYSIAPIEAADWVIIADPSPVLASKETRAVIISVEIPKGTIVSGKKWEFWILAYDTNQNKQIRTQLASRWLVTMK
jgi:hypothetical protein